MKKKLILASASPRRKELLEQMGLSFSICPACGEEESSFHEPEDMVKELALKKAREIAAQTEEDAFVIGSDTVVAFQGEILGKPVDEEDAFRMLKSLQGASHMVYTGVAVVDARTGDVLLNFVDGTKVSMYPMTEEWIHRYIETGEPMDKAGAYAIQGGCSLWIKGIEGAYSTVVGFPTARFYQELLKAGVDLLGEGLQSSLSRADFKKKEKRKGFNLSGKDRSMYQACIFDFDGTLCDSVESIAVCANHALRDLGLKEVSLADYKLLVGDGVNMLVKRLLCRNGKESQELFDSLKARYMEYFQEGCRYHVTPYPGIVELLEELKGLGAKLGVISNKPHANTVDVIEQVFGDEIFDWVQGQTKEIPRKPDPAGALYTARRLGVSPKECLYIGDTGTDMKTGTAAGMYTVGVLWGFRDRKELQETGAMEIVEEPSQLGRIYQNKDR